MIEAVARDDDLAKFFVLGEFGPDERGHRVARGEGKKQEDEDRDSKQDGNRHQDASNDVGGHSAAIMNPAICGRPVAKIVRGGAAEAPPLISVIRRTSS